TRRALARADLIVVLQAEAVQEVPRALRNRVHVIYQSAKPLRSVPAARQRSFDVACVGHLRAVKDPMRTAMASRGLPAASRIRVIHAGTALTRAMESRAMRENEQNPRYTWLGSLTTGRARQLIAKSRILVVSSRMEGGANVIAEALIDRTPVIASRISGNLGMLGADYPGYFECGDTAALTRLLWRCENDSSFLRSLQAHCDARRPRFLEVSEREAFAKLFGSVF
ncbi:MAG: glycosyltransferase, partial [Gammaproteobacteria bacterium]|nr:glycosyltransferase [Gammaproteobacteria bacterium]